MIKSIVFLFNNDHSKESDKKMPDFLLYIGENGLSSKTFY